MLLVGEGAPPPLWLRDMTSEAPGPRGPLAFATKAPCPAGTGSPGMKLGLHSTKGGQGPRMWWSEFPARSPTP